MPNEPEQKEIEKKVKCSNCGALLEFKPGSHNQVCIYCGAENAIEQSDEAIEQIDYKKFIREKSSREETLEVVSVRCNSCGASITLEPNVTSDKCPYCATSIVVKSGSTSTLLKPKSLIPFVIDQKKANSAFENWLSGLWFAPSDLKKTATTEERLKGIYVPYWTYDTDTLTTYKGEKGTYYYTTESYTTQENGKNVTKTREVKHTRWEPARGTVSNDFQDVLVIASHSLPDQYTVQLEPWDLAKLVPYNDRYLSGFRCETYQVNVEDGLEIAKKRMEPTIRSTVCSDIGGNEQRIHQMNTNYRNITFKHVLLPIWISSFRYGGKPYRFLVNGQTGEVQGERPYSAMKIFLAIVITLAVIALIVMMLK